MDSPCPCGSAVHAACLRKWIASKGSRQCSICRNKLPIEFAANPPYLVLQVVRHMRGLHWSGEREYVVGFGSAPLGGAALAAASGDSVQQWNPGYVENIVIGSGHECHLALPDPSLSRRHACLSYDGVDFKIEDLHSSAGTYVRAMQPIQLHDQRCEYFKMGRTTLCVDILAEAPLLHESAAARGGSTPRAEQSSSPSRGWSRGVSHRSTQVSPIPSRLSPPNHRTLQQAASSGTFVSGMASTSTMVSTIGAGGSTIIVPMHDASSASTTAASSVITLGRSIGSQPSVVTYQGTATGTNSTQPDGRNFTVAHSSSLAYVTEH